MEFTKESCELYRISLDGHSWATFAITDKGDLFINSDWGYFACCWRAFGGTFKRFLIEISGDYLIRNLERQQLQFGGKAKIKIHIGEHITALFSELQHQLQQELNPETNV
jgi:hypothetical protein